MAVRIYCDDWGCPARISCALHIGRSAAYAAMRVPIPTRRPERKGDAEACDDYRLDRPRPWLARQPGQTTHRPGEFL